MISFYALLMGLKILQSLEQLVMIFDDFKHFFTFYIKG